MMILTLYGALAVFIIVVLGAVALMIRLPIKRFIQLVKEPALLAFTTTSSESAFPMAMENMERLGCSAAHRQLCAADGLQLQPRWLDPLPFTGGGICRPGLEHSSSSLGQQLLILLTLMLSTKGIAAVPRASLVVLAGTLAQFGLPLEGIAVILGVDELMDMARTSTNVIGNCLATAVVARWEGEFNDAGNEDCRARSIRRLVRSTEEIMRSLQEKLPKPEWLKIRLNMGEDFLQVNRMINDLTLHTVCQEARCPNIYECWTNRTATFMIAGDVCTRRCGFCAVSKGEPKPLDPLEPRNVATAVRTLDLQHAVITGVNRDDHTDGGAAHWAETIRAVRAGQSRLQDRGSHPRLRRELGGPRDGARCLVRMSSTTTRRRSRASIIASPSPRALSRMDDGDAPPLRAARAMPSSAECSPSRASWSDSARRPKRSLRPCAICAQSTAIS
jgi:hypothetical protein